MNIYDIAREAGVSITTVSRVINNKDNISKATLAKVKAVLEKYNYTPNVFARGLVSNSMKSIGVITMDIRHPHYANTAYIIEQELRKLDYHVIICNTGGETSVSIGYIKMLHELNVDGLILIGSIFNDDIIKSTAMSYAKDIPLVLANGFLGMDNSYSVLIDDFYGMTLCVDHLVEKNHREIVYVKDADTYSANQKKEGYKSAMNKHGLKVDNSSIVVVERGLEGGYEAVEKLVSLKKEFTAIIFADDITALGGIKKLKELGKTVPGDVAITGCNNSIFSDCSDPELTTLDNKVETVGSLSVKLLTDLIKDRNATSNILIRPELIIKKST